MKKNILLLILLLVAQEVWSRDDVKYPAAAIPDSLKVNAHAVLRDYTVEYNISGPSGYTTKTHIAVTVLDEKGRSYASFADYFWKFSELTDIEGVLYDNEGNEVRKMKKKDLLDRVATGSAFITDLREKYHSFNYAAYPYTTEYVIETSNNTTLFIDPWSPYLDHGVSTEKASVIFTYPSSFPIHIKAENLPTPVPSLVNIATKMLEMHLSGLKPLQEPDKYATLADRSLPRLKVVAEKYTFFDQPGSLATWHDFGEFMFWLNAGRDVLTPEMKKVVHALSDTCSSTAGKIRILYRYLQKNTRYVSIQLNIGGWQTIAAEDVCTRKFGDCKALANFMKAMLKEAGITAYAALVNANPGMAITVDQNFPNCYFNHVILCVPGRADTTWLECTSQELPAGYLSDFTADRNVLLITPSGGVLVKTPKYGIETNIMRRTGTFSVTENNMLTGAIKKEYLGSFWDSNRPGLAASSKAVVNETVNNALGFSVCKVTGYDIQETAETGIPSLTLTMNAIASNELIPNGNNLIVGTGVFNLPQVTDLRPDTSTSDFQIHFGEAIYDTVTIHFEGKYTLDPSVKNVSITYPFGSYTLAYKLENGNTLIKTSAYILNAGIYPASLFKKFTRLSRESLGMNRNKVVLGKP